MTKAIWFPAIVTAAVGFWTISKIQPHLGGRRLDTFTTTVGWEQVVVAGSILIFLTYIILKTIDKIEQEDNCLLDEGEE